MNPVTIRRGTIRFKRRDGESVWMPLVPQYEDEHGPASDAINLLAHELGQVGENEEDFDLEALAPSLLTALAWHYARREEMVPLIDPPLEGFELASHMMQQGKPDVDWYVPGLIAKGQATLIQGREKTSGKSTLLAYVIGALERGEETVFGEAFPRPVRTVWLTEEPEGSLYEKVERFRLGDGVFIARNYALADKDFGGKLALMEQLVKNFKASHLVIDPLSRVGKVEDEAGTELGKRAEEASDFAQRAGVAVTIIHHDSKAEGRAVEDRGRGSTTLPAAVDQIVQIERLAKKAKAPFTRKLTSWGRVDESDWTLDVEFDKPAGTYRIPYQAAADSLLLDKPMTVSQFVVVLGTPDKPANPKTARRRLQKLVEDGNATVDEGKEPFIYSPVLDPN